MQNQEEDKTSLEGKGWDILAGGKQHASEAGGEDPFDLSATGTSPSEDSPFADQARRTPASDASPFDEPVGAGLTSGGENPFDDDATADALDSGHGTTTPSEVPPEAYGDRGRGGERPDSTPTPGAVGEPEPRGLKPEDLGYQPGRERASPPTVIATPVGEPPRDLSPDEEIFTAGTTAPDEPPPPERLVTPSSPSTSGKALSDGVVVSTTAERPLSETLEVAKPSRFAAPPRASALETRFEVYDPFTPTGEPPVLNVGEDLPLDPGLGPVLVTPDRVDARGVSPAALCGDEADRRRIVDGGSRVGHRADRCEAPGGGGPGTGSDRLLVLLPRLPQVDVHVDEARRDEQAGTVDDLGVLGRADVGADRGHEAIG